MVRQFTETKLKASYDLALLQRLAADGQITYASASNIERCLDRLNYGREHLRICIGRLTESDFKKSGRYETGFWMDVYRYKGVYLKYDSPDEGPFRDDLYIKLGLSNNCVSVVIHSFHEWDRVL